MGAWCMFSALLAIAFLWPDPPPVDEELSGKAHTGVYISLFETSLFEPCDSDERWWLDAREEVNQEFADRYWALRAQFEKQSGVALDDGSPHFLLMGSGIVSETGEHGHMGQYNRQFALTSFTEFRLATPDEAERCLTSGFFDDLRYN
ncbi:MAG: hypothetical protein CMI63_19385 [Parvularcula sp.]|nr:hypothetical protein [Parvularcula sp.]